MFASQRRQPQASLLVTVGLLVLVLAATLASYRILPGLFQPLAARVTDVLFQLRSNVESLSPEYDDTVVHVDIDDLSMRELGTYYLDRRQYARLVGNLGRAGVAAQFHDVIFAAPQIAEDDRELLRTTAEAGNVFYGLALGPVPGGRAREPADAETRLLLDRLRWKLAVRGDAASIPGATRYFTTFPQLAAAARGSGFLDIAPDRDGVYRRVPLLARDGDAFLPGMPLLLACDYLGVTPDRIELRPGQAVILRGARRPGTDEARDFFIPIDRAGRMVVNYIGPWGRMSHYPFFAIYEASDDRFMMEDLADELRGKIAVVSSTTSGGGDIGTVPTDTLFPLSGLHANALHTILTGDFLYELSSWEMLLWVQLPLLGLLLAAAVGLRTTLFILVAALLVLAYHGLAILAFLYGNLILDIPGPVITLVGSTLLVTAYRYHLESQARAAVEMQHAARELNTLWSSRGDMPLGIRIGINTGPVVVGNMGSARRLSYTVLGEAVNLAQRLEASAAVGGILISTRTHELLAGSVPTRRPEPIRVKGFDDAVEVYEVTAPERSG